jgi:hypothetical protein
VSENLRYFNIIVRIILIISLVLLLRFSRTRKLVMKIDIYSQKDKYDSYRGIFATAFIFVIFSMFLSYAIDNIRETKL